MPITQAQVGHAMGVLETLAGNRDAGDRHKLVSVKAGPNNHPQQVETH